MLVGGGGSSVVGYPMWWGQTLRPFTESTVAHEAGPLAEDDLMDPDHVPRSLSRTVRRFITNLRG
ncbi:hypothetical protein ACKUVQ_08540 [Mycobacterium seoulense]|uniref:hypothetical protein n=1 Tax=Mycobacterium seoulense TaxID=386911 RepID=UPI003CF4EAC9